MQLFFQQHISPPTITLEPEESKHLTRVLRKREGDTIHITDGEGNLYECKLTDANPKKSILQVVSSEQVPADDFYIHLAIAPTKSPDRMEWMIEKITEIGFHELTLLSTMNSERSFLKTERLHKKMISACKQSLKYHTPKINQTIDFKSLINNSEFDDFEKFIAYVDENHDHHLLDLAKPKGKYVILIGPEGDFDPKEIQEAMDQNFQPISLGKSRLRTETAGLAAIQMLQILNR
ncbi:16S rRNA (uracil(1498)-N(3))-methyltransferase [Algoriphagus zhangzhouensis]|uniref:Ribosomal RNA small subunit methyltransferase E n=1 Tax=Algoriphagus zhangzhouensis TaxID=1073327 RepID=A0A1M7Z480_9BACT|nr:16S rRNA (uracil(1498)-N(3))-methyltransferase [Algoriphagus zhangzhouensis]TDY48570.1 16S rRNA (uracil1498-N3)-methyltransferase [Algoriphagus zhangzhouensis]SHO59622.1 16S rRNA (uracil1498-N3)-methyltransferase [Algoriphagus zhangzhouensis]